ncbi:MAG TPA: transglutaminase domain-containing protein [Pyrinomonadaceae bacterium]|nr:transglutaminase domain-containing protein [Pyrinomonadaceae bacterium]
MNLLTPEQSSRPSDHAAEPSLRVVTSARIREQRHTPKWLVVSGIVCAFIGGFGLSSYWRPVSSQVEPKIQVADFRVQIPEGDTTVVITARDSTAQELGRLQIHREGSAISGVPEETRRIEPRQRLDGEDAAYLRHELNGVVATSDSPWEKANKIRAWLVSQPHVIAMPGLATRRPKEAYQQMKAGRPVLCGNLADIYAALCESVGLFARTVGLSVAVQKGGFGVDTHAGAEVWIPELRGWIYQDPTFNCYWKVDDKPASALMLHEAVMSGKQISFAPREPQVEDALRNYYMDPRLYFRHFSYEYKPGGAVLYFADKRLEPLSLRDKNWIHTSDPLDIQRLDTAGNQVIERKKQIAPGIFVQVLDGDLFVRDRRENSQGIRVRSSSGAVEGCAYLHQRAEDLGLFNARNIATNPSFRLTSRSNRLADSWSITGPVEAMTVSGGQAMAALAGGKLWQRIEAKPHRRYLLYARISVSRGLVNWKLGDSARGAMSMGTVEPERISEVVSDVVESASGYLDLEFEVPSGGAFRVIDVIVAQAPQFSEKMARVASAVRRQTGSLH